MIKLGPAGIPICCDGNSSDGVKAVHKLGLQAMEVEFVRGVHMSVETAKKVGEVAKKLKIELKCLGHNTKVDRPDRFGGIITRANFDSKYTDVSPAFNFETFKKYLKDE